MTRILLLNAETEESLPSRLMLRYSGLPVPSSLISMKSGLRCEKKICSPITKKRFFNYFLRAATNRTAPIRPTAITGSGTGDWVVGTGVGWAGFSVT